MVARLEACPLCMQASASASSIPMFGTFFHGDLVMKKILRPFSLFHWFKKSSCQLLVKECALSTGKLPRRLAQEQCGYGNWQRPKWYKMCWRAVKQKSNQNQISKWSIFELQDDKTNKMTCVPSKDSDQPGHSPSLISLLCPHEETLGAKLPTERTAVLWSVLADAPGWPGQMSQADLSLRWAHRSFCWFCHAASQIIARTGNIGSFLPVHQEEALGMVSRWVEFSSPVHLEHKSYI